MMLVRPETGQAVPVTQILDADRLLRDLHGHHGRGARAVPARSSRRRSRSRATSGPTACRRTSASGRRSRSWTATPAREWGSRSRDAIPGASSSSPGCGSRTSSTTTSGGRRCASSRTARSSARSPSAPTTRARAGGRSSRRCTRARRSPSGTRTRGATPCTRTASAFRSRRSRPRPGPSTLPVLEPARRAARAELPLAPMLPSFGTASGK